MKKQAPIRNFHLLGVYPESVKSYFDYSLIHKAREKKLIDFHFHPLKKFSKDKFKRVDERPFGGGPGMLIRPDVVTDAMEHIKKEHTIDHSVYLSARGQLLDQKKIQTLFEKHQNFLFLCGRYEGVDQRAIEMNIDEEICIGNYVLSCGEVAALVVIDALVRLIPGVMGNDQTNDKESFQKGLLEYPQYTRPFDFRKTKAPKILLSGHHQKISDWQEEKALETTQKMRPDLLKKK